MKIDLPASLADRVKAAAAQSGESVEALVSRALEAWLGDESDAEALAELERRWAAVRAGEPTVASDAVVRWLDSWGTPAFRPWRGS